MKKKIAVLGGHRAHTMTADFALRGFNVTMFEMSEFRANVKKLFKTAKIRIEGLISRRAKLAEDDRDYELACYYGRKAMPHIKKVLEAFFKVVRDSSDLTTIAIINEFVCKDITKKLKEIKINGGKCQ